jgi:hypothetical protein
MQDVRAKMEAMAKMTAAANAAAAAAAATAEDAKLERDVAAGRCEQLARRVEFLTLELTEIERARDAAVATAEESAARLQAELEQLGSVEAGGSEREEASRHRERELTAQLTAATQLRTALVAAEVEAARKASAEREAAREALEVQTGAHHPL